MKRILIISNRLPVSVKKGDGGITIKPSVGGLATGMKTFYKTLDSVWIGWPGIDKQEISPEDEKNIYEQLKQERCEPLYINKRDFELFYYGFSNKTIWPLFHYFPQYTDYHQEYWLAYQNVNELFAEKVLSMIREDDYIWIHDYHLLLLPKLIRDRFPNATIGFFNHIPFPSYELFRLLPWREKILEGMLGADLIGFHTYDYERHFSSCVRRLLGHDYVLNRINLGDRIIKVDNFPMGIDYNSFYQAALKIGSIKKEQKTKLQKDIESFFKTAPQRKLILSIDRLDYTKGISNRLYAFRRFLEKYPEYHDKVTLILLAVPSRSKVEQYQIMKREVDELVGHINGKWGNVIWTPVWYFYRSLPFESLIILYYFSDIGLITPVRDGMNLVAKEFIATKTTGKGVLILSEMAGAAKEMNEAILINPNNIEAIADSIATALKMNLEEQSERNSKIQERLKRYNVERWANEFLNGMKGIRNYQKQFFTKRITQEIIQKILDKYKKSGKNILFLDYNGTLVGTRDKSEYALPDKDLYKILDKLQEDHRNEVVLISSRDMKTLDKWFGNKDYILFAEHGMWEKKEKNSSWIKLSDQLHTAWKKMIRPVLELYVDRTPGSFIEEKSFSLAWHYENTDPDYGLQRAFELKDELTERIINLDLQVVEGNKVVEIKNLEVNKGTAAQKKISDEKYDFILAIGDDWTDEYLFNGLPEYAFTINVGLKHSRAKYYCESHHDVRDLLKEMCKTSI
jgi:trehalose 6-phosphate synthase/phosphatase